MAVPEVALTGGGGGGALPPPPPPPPLRVALPAADGGRGHGLGEGQPADGAARAVYEGQQRVSGAERQGLHACSVCALAVLRLSPPVELNCAGAAAAARRRPGVLVLVNDTDWELW